MRRIGRNRLFWFGITLFLLMTGLFSWIIYREIRRIQVDRSLIQAIKRNDAASVSMLLTDGADANARDRTLKPISIWQLVLDRLRGKSPSSASGPTALLVALEAQLAPDNRLSAHPTRYTRIVRMLIEHGALPNVRGTSGYTPLMMAAWTADSESVNALLAHGAQVDAEDDYHGAALQYATWAGSQECVQALVAHGAAVANHGEGGNDALIGAADANRLDTLKYLLDHGADPNAKNRAGTTALMLMVRHGNTAAVRLLLSRGADPNASDIMGRNSLYWLRSKPHSEIASMLRHTHASGATR